MQSELYYEILEHRFNCNNEKTKAYIDLRNRFMMGGKNSVLDRLVNYGGKKHALYLYNDLKNSDTAYFYQLMLKKYCSVDVLGESEYKSKIRELGVIGPNGTYIKLVKILDEGEVK